MGSSALSAVLTVSSLSKQFGSTRAVDNISFEITRNEIVGLLGPNGAGKTTTINMILGVLEPTAGTVCIEGYSVTKQRAQALSCANFTAAYAPLPGNLTVYENLRVFALIYDVANSRSRVEAVLEQFDLVSLRNVKCGLLSSGEQTRAALAKAMLNRPRLLLLDEPTASLDPSMAQDIRAGILQLVRDEGVGVLWTSHNMREVEQVCDRVLLLSRGNILLQGNPLTLPASHGKESLEALFISVAREPLSTGET